jgi:bacterioferritin
MAEVTKEQLLEGLNTDLGHEYQAIIMYVTYAATVSGIHREELKGFFLKEVPEELRHAQFLADKISALGGTPTTQPAGSVPPAVDPKSMLQNVMRAEDETIQRYVERMKQAEAYGDYGLANDLQEIISEETRHKEDTEKLLRGS